MKTAMEDDPDSPPDQRQRQPRATRLHTEDEDVAEQGNNGDKDQMPNVQARDPDPLAGRQSER